MTEVGLSVVVPCYELERFVGACLDSLAPIGRGGGELVVVDDGSSDGSRSRIESWAAAYDGRCRTVFHDTNRGAPAAFNSGLAAASEPLLCFVDADDVVDPDALMRQARLLADGPSDVVAGYGDVDWVDESGRPIPAEPGRPYAPGSERIVGDVRAALVSRGSICPLLGTVVRTADVRRVGGFDESLRFCDWPLWLKLAPLGRFVFSGETVGLYRQHPGSMSRRQRDRLDQDRLRLLVGLARDPRYRDLRSEIAERIGQLVSTMIDRGNRPRPAPLLASALTLRNPRLLVRLARAQLVRAGSTVSADSSGSAASTVSADDPGRASS